MAVLQTKGIKTSLMGSVQNFVGAIAFGSAQSAIATPAKKQIDWISAGKVQDSAVG